jgi:cytidine deaminase
MSHDLFRQAARTAMAQGPCALFEVSGGGGAAHRGRAVYAGANIENASFPEGWCAETTALAHYVMGGGGEIVEIAVVAERWTASRPAAAAASDWPSSPGRMRSCICATQGVVETNDHGRILPLGFRGDQLK